MSQKYRLGWIFLLALNAGLELLRGGKAFLLNIVVYVILFNFLDRDDWKISVRQMALLMSVGFIASILAFPMATAVRSVAVANGAGVGAGQAAVGEVATIIFDAGSLSDAINAFTRRLVGYDGLLATNAVRFPDMEKVFSESNILNSYLARLIPGYQGSGLALGRAVSFFYSGFPLSIQNAGALGLFASLSLLGGLVKSLLYCFLLGVLFGLLSRRVASISGQPVRLFVGSLLLMQMLAWFSSGNFDGTMQSSTILVVQTVSFVVILKILYKVGSHRLANTRMQGIPVHRVPQEHGRSL